MATDLSIELLGHRLASPLILSSGPLTASAESIRVAFEAGAAGAVTKTISRLPAVNPTPHIARAAAGLLNSEKWSDLSAWQWIERELPALRERSQLLIASLGHTAADAQALAAPLVQAGVDMLEVVSYCSEDMAPLVRAAKGAGVPVLAKVSANWPDLLATVGDCIAAGADGITAIDSLGPALAIDIETAQPILGGTWGAGWLSGAAIKPIAVRAVAEIARRYPVPVLGVGGVSRAEDVVEMMMAGAAAVQVHTAPLLDGSKFFRQTEAALESWLAAHGHAAARDLWGLALPHLQAAEDVRPLSFAYDAELCSGCGLCVRVCAYRARTLTGTKMALDRARCRSCGLCASICPARALRLGGRVG